MLSPANYADLERFDRDRRSFLQGLGATLLSSAVLQLGANSACTPQLKGTAPMPPSRLDEAVDGADGAKRGAKERSDGRDKGKQQPMAGGTITGCFKSEASMYWRVVLCLGPPTLSSGQFSLAESESVPDATLNTHSEGSYVISHDRVMLTVERINYQTIGEQPGGESSRSEPRWGLQPHHSSQRPRRALHATVTHRGGIVELSLSTYPELRLRR
jgi:hypothetical protein